MHTHTHIYPGGRKIGCGMYVHSDYTIFFLSLSIMLTLMVMMIMMMLVVIEPIIIKIAQVCLTHFNESIHTDTHPYYLRAFAHDTFAIVIKAGDVVAVLSLSLSFSSFCSQDSSFKLSTLY